MKRIRKALCRLLCAVILAGACACSGEKSASGQKVAVPQTQQEKTDVTYGKNREKYCSLADCAPDKIVVENSMSGLESYGLLALKPGTFMIQAGATREEISRSTEQECAE